MAQWSEGFFLETACPMTDPWDWYIYRSMNGWFLWFACRWIYQSMDPMGVACDVKEITFLIEHKGFTCSVNEGPGCLWSFFAEEPYSTVFDIGSFHGFFGRTRMKRVAFSATKWKLPQSVLKYRRADDLWWWVSGFLLMGETSLLMIHIYICIIYVLVYIQGCIQIYIYMLMDVYSYIDGYIYIYYIYDFCKYVHLFL